jgi:NAD(P)-dependent dehydrogenase (short-subunit alcohol dehydrogenase family)
MSRGSEIINGNSGEPDTAESAYKPPGGATSQKEQQMSSLEDKVAVVTGAGRGIGRGIALRLAKEGARVVVASRSTRSVDAVVAEITAHKGQAVGVTVDVGDRSQVQRMADVAVAAFGPVHILVNNAQSFGTSSSRDLYPKETPLETFDEAVWDHTYQSGLKGTLYGMWAVFPGMQARKWGRIINFGSRLGQLGVPGMAAYNSTKEAIRGLTRTAAREWAQYGITVNCINPVIATDAVTARMEELGAAQSLAERTAMQQARSKLLPMGYGDAERDAGGLAAYLASDDAGFLTGMTFMLDGGVGPLP